jgi:hypothetical protein
LALNQQGRASDDQWAVRAGEHAAECLDRTPIRVGCRPVVREIVDKSCVDHSVGSRRSATKAFEIFERTAMYVGSGCGKGFGCRIRASETEHLMTSVDQLSDD